MKDRPASNVDESNGGTRRPPFTFITETCLHRNRKHLLQLSGEQRCLDYYNLEYYSANIITSRRANITPLSPSGRFHARALVLYEPPAIYGHLNDLLPMVSCLHLLDSGMTETDASQTLDVGPIAYLGQLLRLVARKVILGQAFWGNMEHTDGGMSVLDASDGG